MDRQANTSVTKDTKRESEGTEGAAKTEQKAVGKIPINIGLDISTSIVGVIALEEKTEKLVIMDAIKLTGTKFPNVWVKSSYVKNRLPQLIDPEKYKVKNIFVEEAHMKFTPGFSSAGTLFSLARFNGIVSYIACEIYDVEPEMINVRSARKHLGIKINFKDKSKDTKTKVFEAVKSMNPDFPWVQHVAKGGKHKGETVWSKENFDMADAYVICAGGKRVINLPPPKPKKKKPTVKKGRKNEKR